MLTSWTLIVAIAFLPATGKVVFAGGRQPLSLIAFDLLRGDVEQLVLVRDDDVAPEQVAELPALDRARRHLGRRRAREAVGEELHEVGVGVAGRGHLGGAARQVRQSAAGRQQADADLDEAHVAFHRRDPARAVDRDLVAAAEGDPAHRGDDRHGRVADPQHRVLQLLDLGKDALAAALHEHRHQRLEVGAGREHVVGRPDHEALVRALGEIDRLQQPFDHRRADEVQLGGDAGDQHLAVERPDADLVVLEDLGAGLERRRRLGAEHGVAERLALVHRQGARRDEARVRSAVRAFRPVHAGVGAAEPVEDPGRQRRAAERLAGVDVFLHPLRDLRPAGLLPELERPLAGAEAPAHREVDVARALGDVAEVDRA
jgi:hypothetical protein